MLTLQYLTFMTSASATGNLDIQFQTYDLPANVTFTLAASGITGSESPTQLAFIVSTQISTYLYQLGYSMLNVPPSQQNLVTIPNLYYPDQAPAPSFNCTFTDMCVCVSGQSDFTLSVTANTTGSRVLVGESPTLITLDEAKRKAAAMQLPFVDIYGDPLSDEAIIELLYISSDELTNFLNNNIVSSTYIMYEETYGTKSLFLPIKPIIDFFPPVVRRPNGMYTFQQWYTYGTVKSNFGINKTTGELYYRFSQDFFFNLEPFDDGNDVMVGYVSGFKHIPAIIKEYVLRFTTITTNGINLYKSMQGQSFKVEYVSRKELYAQMLPALGVFFN